MTKTMLQAAALFIALSAEQAPTQVEELLAKQVQLEAQIVELQQGFLDMRVSEARRLGTADDAARRLSVDITTSLDYMWLLICGSMVMFMQAGFAILESGACRQKNAGMVLTKNVIDACGGTLVWYLVGYGLAYGPSVDNPNEFIGTRRFAGQFESDGAQYKDWFFQWAFCATAATIVSGSVAERINFVGYFAYSIVMTGLIYPVVVYWTWSGQGFLTKQGYSDFAGSGIVHLTGGISALVGAVVIGPRQDRWAGPPADPHRFDPHNMALVVLGTFILWFGWYGFNCGSTLAFSNAATANTAAIVAMNTTVAAAMGGMSVFVLRLRSRKIDLAGTCNGILVGLVASCAGADVFEPHACLLVGFCGALAHECGSITLKKLGVDDPLDAFAVHGCGGMTGVLLRPLLDKRGSAGMDDPSMGKMFGAHCLAIAVIIAWAGGLSFISFVLLRLAGVLRISEHEELDGTDQELSQQIYRGGSEKKVASDKIATDEPAAAEQPPPPVGKV